MLFFGAIFLDIFLFPTDMRAAIDNIDLLKLSVKREIDYCSNFDNSERNFWYLLVLVRRNIFLNSFNNKFCLLLIIGCSLYLYCYKIKFSKANCYPFLYFAVLSILASRTVRIIITLDPAYIPTYYESKHTILMISRYAGKILFQSQIFLFFLIIDNVFDVHFQNYNYLLSNRSKVLPQTFFLTNVLYIWVMLWEDFFAFRP